MENSIHKAGGKARWAKVPKKTRSIIMSELAKKRWKKIKKQKKLVKSVKVQAK